MAWRPFLKMAERFNLLVHNLAVFGEDHQTNNIKYLDDICNLEKNNGSKIIFICMISE